MKKSLIIAAVAAASFAVKAEYQPEQWVMDARQKFADQRFGIFIHWGIYANYAQGEWYLHQGKLDEADYSRMLYGFCPSKYDAKEWVKTFKDAGAKYVTITSRHHDGFSLWPTKADDGYNIANTPFKRDILGELAAACKEGGLQLNFYYSTMDWHRKDYPVGKASSQVKLTGRKPDYASYKKFMLAQISELIDSYHPGNIWFDGEWDHGASDRGAKFDWGYDEIFDLIHSKKTLIANNNHQPIREKEDIQIFERDLPGENATGFSKGQTVTFDRPVEQCDVIQHNVWGYRIGEKSFRTAEDVVSMVARAASKNSNLLMNIGPNGAGELPAQAVTVMKEVGKWFAKNGESIYGTTAAGVASGKDVVSTRKGDVLYLHFLNPAVDQITFKLDGAVSEAKCLACGKDVPVTVKDGQATVKVTRPADCKFDLVVKLTVR